MQKRLLRSGHWPSWPDRWLARMRGAGGTSPSRRGTGAGRIPRGRVLTFPAGSGIEGEEEKDRPSTC
jgi:hypothetical protein